MGHKARGKQLAQHLSGEAEWLSPKPFIDLAHIAFDGPPALDPASTAFANTRVGAQRFYTAEDDGLSNPWSFPSIFFNSPGMCGWDRPTAKERRDRRARGAEVKRGAKVTRVCRNWKRCSCSLPLKFWERSMIAHRSHGSQIFMVGFTVNHLRMLQYSVYGGPLSNGIVCVPKKRYPYVLPDGTESDAPSHDSFLFYAGARWNWFAQAARKLGDVVCRF